MLRNRNTHTVSDHSRGHSSSSHEGSNHQFEIDMEEALNKMLTTVGKHTHQNDQIHKETDDLRGELEALKNDYSYINLMVVVHNQILVVTMTCPCKRMRNKMRGTNGLPSTAIENTVHVSMMTHLRVNQQPDQRAVKPSGRSSENI